MPSIRLETDLSDPLASLAGLGRSAFALAGPKTMNTERKQIRRFSKYCFPLHADELYVLTRFAYFAFLRNVVFRNAHHTLEYYFKAGLADSIPVEELKRLGHYSGD